MFLTSRRNYFYTAHILIYIHVPTYHWNFFNDLPENWFVITASKYIATMIHLLEHCVLRDNCFKFKTIHLQKICMSTFVKRIIRPHIWKIQIVCLFAVYLIWIHTSARVVYQWMLNARYVNLSVFANCKIWYVPILLYIYKHLLCFPIYYSWFYLDNIIYSIKWCRSNNQEENLNVFSKEHET